MQIQAQKKVAPLIAVEHDGKQSDNKMKVFEISLKSKGKELLFKLMGNLGRVIL